MTTFDEREAAFENKFTHDENLKFAATARACRRVALWVARSLGMGREDAEKYAKNVALADLQEPGHADFLSRLRQDLRGRIPDAELQRKMTEEVHTAMEEILADPDFNPA
ncbi:DUF1476 domain-containing protein [Epibacterium ulvae]|uniref:DUF1476 domain-containing protein n=1 Tax=Epibacterium ulvae TaxID=1156985 RepID=UPI001BFC35E3|nr:DUF1476 domain-containing protein [Epibacterium ulvae]MBT8154605.1 DUF1476 domain-containing protein [Epibacterium ulvae]